MVQFDFRKGTEAVLYIVQRVHIVADVWAIVYLAEKKHLELHGRTVYSDTYLRLEQGPVEVFSLGMLSQSRCDFSMAAADGHVEAQRGPQAVMPNLVATQKDEEGNLVYEFTLHPSLRDAIERVTGEPFHAN